jgi:hypothetical protein
MFESMRHNPGRYSGFMSPAPFHARKGMLKRFIFALFSKGPPVTNHESLEESGEGNEALQAAAGCSGREI